NLHLKLQRAQFCSNLILCLCVSAGFSRIGNAKQCREAHGKCVRRRCPGDYKRIGNCARKIACCSKKI
uniref:Beta-defensin-like domain-containing protein n=1 Tax=Podarcis muralis TaxID=64176 RepID=A0A670I9Y5_PODMU